ncbi:MAG: DNA-processing protein DprA [Acidimicrobiales bacterium]
MGAALPPEAWLVALAALPDMGPARLRALLDGREPLAAWNHVLDGSWVRSSERGAVRGDRGALGELWKREACLVDVDGLWSRHLDAGIGVAARGSAAYPAAFVDDIDPPSVLFSVGDPAIICGPRVAIVGTRSATLYGLDVAFELGRDLAEAGVGVVSGLALGIDGAAHAGALDGDPALGGGPAIAVVGSGLDVLYPAAHRELWRAVAARGVVLSEAPLGARPHRWRFPARNRLLAALGDVVVVVESRETGGSMSTVEEAVRRDRPVMAVPGPVRSPASAGANRLLGECAMPASCAADVLLALGLTSGSRRAATDPRPAPSPSAASILDAIGWQPASVEQLVLRSGLRLGQLLLSLDELRTAGWVAERAGWYEQVSRPER